jgi:hypothetical protein
MNSIEWLIEQLRQLAHNDKHHLGMGDIRITQGMLDDFYEQAKEMHKQEIIDAYKNYQSYLIEEFLIKEQAHKGIIMHKPFEGNSKTFEQWVETYGSKGSDEVELPHQEISINELKNICQSVIDNTPSDATEKEIGYTKAMEHIIKIIDGKPHKYLQQEISDTEIEFAGTNAWVEYNLTVSDDAESFYAGWKLALKWYREQIKQKQ